MVAKRVDIISLKIVKDSSILYASRHIRTPQDGAELCRMFLEDDDRERFLAIYLNTKNEPVSIQTISIGTVNASLVHPRELFKGAILCNATAIILAHNHPSGTPDESPEDLAITKRVIEASKIIGIEILDHIIIGHEGRFVSFKEKNLL